MRTLPAFLHIPFTHNFYTKLGLTYLDNVFIRPYINLKSDFKQVSCKSDRCTTLEINTGPV